VSYFNQSGGHATNLALAHDSKISVGVSICGCGDYQNLITKRAKRIGYDTPPESYRFISQKILDCVNENDPIKLAPKFKGRKLLLLSGGESALQKA
jgi:hypothetical protein